MFSRPHKVSRLHTTVHLTYVKGARTPQSVQLLSYDLRSKESLFDSCKEQEIFLFSKAARPPLMPIQHPNLSLQVNEQGCEADISTHCEG
jgi:hypothetical protein